MSKKRMITAIVEIIIGIALLAANRLGQVDEFWSGMGAALIVVGAMILIRAIRYRNDESYRENYDTQTKDERNRYLAMKAWSWAGYIFVLIAAVATIALKIAGQESLMFMASGSVCLILVLYWLSYLVLRKKY